MAMRKRGGVYGNRSVAIDQLLAAIRRALRRPIILWLDAVVLRLANEPMSEPSTEKIPKPSSGSRPPQSFRWPPGTHRTTGRMSLYQEARLHANPIDHDLAFVT
jgi:hypothetical protein